MELKTVIKLYEITQEGLEQLKYVQDLLESIPDGSEIKKSSKKEVEKPQPELVPISNPEPMDGLKPTQNLVIPDVMSAEEIAKKYKQDLMLFGMDVYRIPATRDTTKEEMQNINLLSKKVATLFAKILTKMNAK